MQSLRSRGRIYFAVRYGLLIALIVVVVIFAAGRRESRAPFETVSQAVAAQIGSGRMEKAESRYLKKIYGLNAGDYEDVMIYVPANSMSAREMLLIKLSSSAQEEEVLQAIQERIDSQYNIFEGYAPEQVAVLEQAIVDSRGSYILYISGEDAAKADEVFRNSL